ncbi:patatin-like phospholipase family protein [Niveibacterium sp. SC-1]|uniref:patatin-like phospholipase family protein n=1 Tax=Niveibacterium sp. SC-1 TaxID=3135646 RepID=UPI00311DCA9C
MDTSAQATPTERAALVLTGGGARAAYQVGVLRAVSELWGTRAGNPFPIVCGTSAGAINATALAAHAHNFGHAVRRLSRIWRHFHVAHVYRADVFSIARSALTWASTLFMGWLLRRSPRSLLDNAPLRVLLREHVDFSGIDRAIASGALYAASVTCCGYASGESLSFFQAHAEVSPWRRASRVGVATSLNVDHLMASSAIPFVFPAVRIHREFFGDGSMRQHAPISPAIHLGASRILVVGAGRPQEESRRVSSDRYPPLAQIAGHAMSSIFLDGLAIDVERLERINDTLGKFDEAQRAAAGVVLKPIETLVIAPSERLDFIAARHYGALPWPIRLLLRGVGGGGRGGSTVLSYLLFEEPYTRALMELGYHDAMAMREELVHFLRLEEDGADALADAEAEASSQLTALSS